MATMFYDKDADHRPDPRAEGRRDRIRLAGARARAQPAGQRRRASSSDFQRGQQVGREGRGRRAEGAAAWPTRPQWADVIMILIPDTARRARL